MRQELEAALEKVEDGVVVPVDEEREHFLREYDLPETKIAELAAKFMSLKIADIADRQGYNAVHEARIMVRDYRLDVDKTRKRLKAQSLEYGRKVDREAARLTNLLDPIETHLANEEKRVDDEKARIKAEEQRKADALLQDRVNKMTAVGGTVTIAELAMMTEMVFEVHLKAAADAWEAKEKIRLQQEVDAKRLADLEAEKKAREEAEAAAAREAEAKRQAEIRAEQEIERQRLAAAKAEQDQKEAELRARQEAVERQEREVAQRETDRKNRLEAEAQARADAERKVRDDEARRIREAAELDAKQKAAASAKPDADKLLVLAMEIENWNMPDMATEAGRDAMTEIQKLNQKLAAYVRTRAQALTK